MHLKSCSRNSFKLENLEPRLLLSADAVLGSAAEETYSQLEDTTEAIVMDYEAAAEADVNQEDSLFDVQDEAIPSDPGSGTDSVDVRDVGTIEANGEPDCLVIFDNEEVLVIGNNNANRISIVESGGLVSVQCDDGPLQVGKGINGIHVAGMAGDDSIVVELDGTGVRSVKLDAGEGGDDITVNVVGSTTPDDGIPPSLDLNIDAGEGDNVIDVTTIGLYDTLQVSILSGDGADVARSNVYAVWLTTGIFEVRTGGGNDTVEVRQQINQITSFIDGSVIYDTGDGNDSAMFTLFLENGTPLRATMNAMLKLGAGDDLATLDMRGNLRGLNLAVEPGSGADRVNLHLEQGEADNALIHDVKLAKQDLPGFEPADGTFKVRSSLDSGVMHLDTQWLGSNFGDTTVNTAYFIPKVQLEVVVGLNVATGAGNDSLTMGMNADVKHLLFQGQADLGGGDNHSTAVLEFTNEEPMALDFELFFDTYEGKDMVSVDTVLDGIVERGRFDIQANTRGGDDEVHTGATSTRAYPAKWVGPSFSADTGDGDDAVQLVVKNVEFEADIDLGEGDNHFEARLSGHAGNMNVTSGTGDDTIVSKAEWPGDSVDEHPDFAWLPTYNTGGGNNSMQLFFTGKLKVDGDSGLAIQVQLLLGDGNDETVIDMSGLTIEGATRQSLIDFQVDGGLGDDNLTVALPAVQNPDPSQGGEEPEPIDPAERRAPVSVRNISGPGLDRIHLIGKDAAEQFNISAFEDENLGRVFELIGTDIPTRKRVAKISSFTVEQVIIEASGGDDIVNLKATIPAQWNINLGEGDNVLKANAVGGVPPDDSKPAEFNVLSGSGNDLIDVNAVAGIPPDDGSPVAFTLRVDAGDGDNATYIRLGDGEPGQTPPTGESKARAEYRSGSGADTMTITYTGLELTDLDIDALTGAGDDVSKIAIKGAVEHVAINLDLGDGDDTSIRALTGLVQTLDLLAKLGEGNDNSSLIMDGVLNAKVHIDGGTGSDFVNVESITSFNEFTDLNQPVSDLALFIDTGDGDDVIRGATQLAVKNGDPNRVTRENGDPLAFSSLTVDLQTGLGDDTAIWTDFNTHDPGVTLIRLFDFLADLGAGDDQLQVDVLGAASSGNLTANLKIDGGRGADRVAVDWVDRLGPDDKLDLTVDVAPGGVGNVLPEVEDEVLLGFEHGGVRTPVIIGALWNSKDAPPESTGDSNGRGIQSSVTYVNVHTPTSGTSIQFDLQGSTGEDFLDLNMVNGATPDDDLPTPEVIVHFRLGTGDDHTDYFVSGKLKIEGDMSLGGGDDLFAQTLSNISGPIDIHVDGGDGMDIIDASATAAKGGNDVAIEELVLAAEGFETGIVTSMGFDSAGILFTNNEVSIGFTGRNGDAGGDPFVAVSVAPLEVALSVNSHQEASVDVHYFDGRLLTAADLRTEFTNVGEVTVDVEGVGPDGRLSQISVASTAQSGRHTHTGQYHFLLELGLNGAVQHLDAELSVLGTSGDDTIMLDVQGEADILDLSLDVDTGAGNDSIGITLDITPRIASDVDTSIDLGSGNDLLNAALITGLAGLLNLSLDVLGGDGDDTVRIKWIVPPEPIFPPEPILVADVMIDTGAGNDEGEFEFEMLTGKNSTPLLEVQLEMLGGTGRDKLSAKAEFDGPATGFLAMRLLGGDDDDVLRLRNKRLPAGLATFLLIDGGNGIDRCFGRPGVTEINCER